MNIKLVKEAEAPLLSRKVLSFEIEYSGSKTPSKEDVRKTIASLQKVKEELVVVKHVYPRFGKSKAEIIAHVYNAIQDLKNYEPKPKKEGKKKAEKPAEKKEEKPKKENVNAKKESEEQKA